LGKEEPGGPNRKGHYKTSIRGLLRERVGDAKNQANIGEYSDKRRRRGKKEELAPGGTEKKSRSVQSFQMGGVL